MSRLAIIAGTGLYTLPGAEVQARHEQLSTPWGEPSGVAVSARMHDIEVVFLPRHGEQHSAPPHAINYRANIDALRQLDVTRIVAVAAVGAIDTQLAAGGLACPRQIIDYTWGRPSTFHDGAGSGVEHVDFTEPYCADTRARLLAAAADAGIAMIDGGCYGATQGPRLESAAEIDRLDRDGCTLVGMTGMPEAALAREAEIAYAHLAVNANAAAGRGDGVITMDEIRTNLTRGMRDAVKVLEAFVRASS